MSFTAVFCSPDVAGAVDVPAIDGKLLLEEADAGEVVVVHLAGGVEGCFVSFQ